MFSSSPQIPILLKEKKKKTLIFLPRRMRSEDAKKEDILCHSSRSASKPAQRQLPCRAASSTAQSREQDEFYEPYLLLGPKAKRKEEGRKQNQQSSYCLIIELLQRS